MRRPIVKRAFQLIDGDRVRITGAGDFVIRDVRESDVRVCFVNRDVRESDVRICFAITLNDRRRVIGLPAHEHVLTIDENDD